MENELINTGPTSTHYIKIGNGKAKLFNNNDTFIEGIPIKNIPKELVNETKYLIELNEKQLILVWRYLETLSRINSLQLDEAVDGILNNLVHNNYLEQYSQEYFAKKEQLKTLFDYININICGGAAGGNLGIGNVCNDDQICYEMYKIIGNALYNINGEDSWNVYSSLPLKYSDQPLIKVSLKEESIKKSDTTVQELIKLLEAGVKPTIQFNKNHSYDADPDMKGQIISFEEDDIDDEGSISYKFVVDISGYEDYNKSVARNIWVADSNGEYTKTWFESGFYPKDGLYDIWAMNYQSCIDAGFDFVENKLYLRYIESKTELSYLQWLEEGWVKNNI
jgi:hypothetical protein